MCCWQLQAPPGTSLLLAFGDVDLEPSEHCAHSSLLLTDPQTGTAYGKGSPEAVGCDTILWIGRISGKSGVWADFIVERENI